MEYRDKNLVCIECHQPFVWTAGEQLFFADKNFKNEPKRCKVVQGEAQLADGDAQPRARGDHGHLLAVRQGDDGALPPDPGAPRLLQGLLSTTQVGPRRLRRPLPS